MLAQQDLANELLLFLFRRSSLGDYSLGGSDVRRDLTDVVVTGADAAVARSQDAFANLS